MLSHRAQNRRALGMESGWVGGVENAEEGPLVGGKVFRQKQQMQWTPCGAHLLLQTRTKVLNGELDEVFRRWYPQPQTNIPDKKVA